MRKWSPLDWLKGVPPPKDTRLGEVKSHDDGFILGRDGSGKLVYYGGNGHIVTIAPSRSGKFVSVIAPNLGYWPGSVLAIDPKGEQAIVCGAVREKLGQKVFYLNPFDLHGLPCHSFNPMGWLTPDSPRFATDARMMAHALIEDRGGEDGHWTREGRSLLEGLILHVATAEEFEDARDLVTVRQLLTQNENDLVLTFKEMQQSEHPNVREIGAMMEGKPEKERGSVLSTARSNTHILSIGLMQKVLGRSDFDLMDLKRDKISVFLILPISDVKEYPQWLRLMVAMAMQAILRVTEKADHQVLMVLDEFFSLGHLEDIEIASGAMPGMGLKLHLVLQSLSQLSDKYPNIWGDFVSNAGALQAFNTSDPTTADYLSSLVSGRRMSEMDENRVVMTPGEIMYGHPGKILVRVQGSRPFWIDPVVFYDKNDKDFAHLPYRRDNPC